MTPHCMYCGREVNGAPGGWYQVEGPQYETCDSGRSPTGFHEVEGWEHHHA